MSPGSASTSNDGIVPKTSNVIEAIVDNCVACTSTRYTIDGNKVTITIPFGCISYELPEKHNRSGVVIILKSDTDIEDPGTIAFNDYTLQFYLSSLLLERLQGFKNSVYELLLDIIQTLVNRFRKMRNHQINFVPVQYTWYNTLGFSKFVGKLIILDCNRKPSSRIAVYGMTVTDHSDTSVEKHLRNRGTNSRKRVIGYIPYSVLRNMKTLYETYGIQDAPLTYNTQHTMRDLFAIHKYIEYIAQKYSGNSPMLNKLVDDFRHHSRDLDKVVGEHKDDAFYIIPYGYFYGMPQYGCLGKIFPSGHQIVILICNKTLFFIDPNCARNRINLDAIEKTSDIAAKYGLRYEIPLEYDRIFQACEAKHNYTAIDRPGYCVPWSLLICEILARNAQQLSVGKKKVKTVLIKALAKFSPEVLRKIIVDYTYSLSNRANR